MTLTVEAVYENGVLKPLAPINLTEHQQVTVQVTTPETSHAKADPSAVSSAGIWSPERDDIAATIAAVRTRAAAKLQCLAAAEMPQSNTISIKGIWSHIDADALEQALADVRSKANQRLQRLTDEL